MFFIEKENNKDLFRTNIVRMKIVFNLVAELYIEK